MGELLPSTEPLFVPETAVKSVGLGLYPEYYKGRSLCNGPHCMYLYTENSYDNYWRAIFLAVQIHHYYRASHGTEVRYIPHWSAASDRQGRVNALLNNAKGYFKRNY